MEDPTGSRRAGTVDDAYHASFVLRCWTDAGDTVRLRVIDARSGVQYPLPSLLDLPALIERLIFRAASSHGGPEGSEGQNRETQQLEDITEDRPP